MTDPPWTWARGDDPILATAIHAGSQLREHVAALTALDGAARLREEDPFTGAWTDVAANRCVFSRSRFEVDVNRTRDMAVYLQAEDCWGLQPWRSGPPLDLVNESLGLYDRFYDELFHVCDELEQRWGTFVVLDLHSYNHRRLGPDHPPADPAGNPDVNVGTATVDTRRWGGLVERFVADMSRSGLDVRKNVRFGGATLAAEIHRRFPSTGCCLAVDVKKIYMDEHTGVLDPAAHARIGAALAVATQGLRDAR